MGKHMMQAGMDFVASSLFGNAVVPQDVQGRRQR